MLLIRYLNSFFIVCFRFGKDEFSLKSYEYDLYVMLFQ